MKLKLSRRDEHIRLKFKQHINNVHGVVSVLSAISSSVKNKIDMNKSMFTRTTHQKSVSSIRENNVNKTSEHCPSVSPRNERHKAIILDKSISPNWDRLSKPRYVSPLISINRSLNEHRTENVLPTIKNKESEIEKQIRTKRQKVKDLL